MLRKSVLKATLSDQVEVNTVKDYDIIKLYQKHHEQGTEKQRRISEIQRRAVRNNGIDLQRQRKPPRRVRVADRTFLPQIVTNVAASSLRDNGGKMGNDEKNNNDGKTQDVHLPPLQAEKGRSMGGDSHDKTRKPKDVVKARDRFDNTKTGNGERDGYDHLKTQDMWDSKKGYVNSEAEKDITKNGNDTKTVHLPRIPLDKAGPVKGKRSENQRQPVYDPRFRSLLSSLIALPQQFGQIQCYAPSTRLSYATMQKQK